MLKKYPEFEVVAEAGNADEAKEQIEAKHPDLLLLDIEMPEKNGFELLESLENAPAVLFITAYNQYAVQAFEINALDYLVKPIRDERLAKAIEKVRTNIGIASARRQIFIKDGEQCHFIPVNDIYLIESLDNYSRLYFREKKLVLKRSLRQWERMLDTNSFFRISRTQVINTNYIQEMHNIPGGRLKINLKTGQLLEVSARQSVKFRQLNGI